MVAGRIGGKAVMVVLRTEKLVRMAPGSTEDKERRMVAGKLQNWKPGWWQVNLCNRQ